MTTTYTWNFPAADVRFISDGEEDVVQQVHWRLSATDAQVYQANNPEEAVLASVYGTFNPGALDPADFTAFASLTEVQLVVWAEKALDVPALKAQLDAQLATQAAPAGGVLPFAFNEAST